MWLMGTKNFFWIFWIQAASSWQGLDLNDKIKEYLREDETSFKKLWTNKRWKDSKLGGVAQAVGYIGGVRKSVF